MRLVMGVVAATATANGNNLNNTANLNNTLNKTNGKNMNLSGTGTGTGTGTGNLHQHELLSDKNILHTPFHTKELMWNRSKYL